MSSPQITTLVKIMETLPDSLQEKVTEHLREYIYDLQDDIKWSKSFEKTQSKLVMAARRAKQEIAEGKAVALDYEQL
ncbi:hypothetical protein [Pseudanabaena yagii]|uniref:DUF2281 domain-containing protein n=1 Tax=Pseudanabaena yagii GIHE-NHR1 TaxID=2722753 RepID=A0ABX1LKU6_9CYAN|nr:hypothetical protein [Pseudanabaena yagii]NMF56688.1 hypothetical protein [Pseudanabaena yagii GIHE-NHR1]